MPTDFYWIIKNVIAGMSHPGQDPEVLRQIKDMGVGSIVSLTESAPSPDLLRRYGLRFLHLPVTDFMAPRQNQIDRFIEFCEERDDHAIVVHCLAGRGRTGTMLGCFLVRRGLSARESIEKVRTARPGAIESFEQETAVYEFECREEAGEPPAPPNRDP